MKLSGKIFLILFAFGITTNTLKAQDCGCNVQEVIYNSVKPCDKTVGTVIKVSTVAELKSAFSQANEGDVTILIADGTYQVASTSSYPYITGSNVVIRSESGNRDAVIITGSGMAKPSSGSEMGISAQGNNITIADLTIKDIGNHGIMVAGTGLYVHNVKIQDTYEQLLKGVTSKTGADDAIIQCSLMEYTAGVGPNWYIGGIDIHDGDNCIVRDNVFRNIASPGQSHAEHAIHFWNKSSNNTVERNIIVNCDRGIGFGLGTSPSEGGIIRNNMIYNNGKGQFNDVGIGLETSPNTKVYNNTIYVAYQNAIEYRFAATKNVDIKNNLTNKAITSRNSGSGIVANNNTNANANWFMDLESGDLRLNSGDIEVINQGTDLGTSVAVDVDRVARPQGDAYDIGADEYTQAQSLGKSPQNSGSVKVYPNPATTKFILQAKDEKVYSVSIYNAMSQLVETIEAQRLNKGEEIYTANWPKGIYFCNVYEGNSNVQTLKIIVSQ